MRKFRFVIAGLIAICILPALSYAVADGIAIVLGCQLQSFSIVPCRIIGIDIGGVLSTMSDAAFALTLTLYPLIGIVGVWVVAEILRALMPYVRSGPS